MKERFEAIVPTLRAAALLGITDGYDNAANREYIGECSWFSPHRGVQIIFTRDTGHHSSGWLKNPDYERCWHLSLSYRAPDPLWSGPAVIHLSTLATTATARTAPCGRSTPFVRNASLSANKPQMQHSRKLSFVLIPKGTK